MESCRTQHSQHFTCAAELGYAETVSFLLDTYGFLCTGEGAGGRCRSDFKSEISLVHLEKAQTDVVVKHIGISEEEEWEEV